MIVRALGSCDPRCPWCAREFWRWLRGRAKNPLMHAAATSVHGPEPGEEHGGGTAIRYADGTVELLSVLPLDRGVLVGWLTGD